MSQILFLPTNLIWQKSFEIILNIRWGFQQAPARREGQNTVVTLVDLHLSVSETIKMKDLGLLTDVAGKSALRRSQHPLYKNHLKRL